MSLDLSVMEKVEKKPLRSRPAMSFPFNSVALKGLSWLFAIADFFLSKEFGNPGPWDEKKEPCLDHQWQAKLTKYLQQSIDGLITDELTEAQRPKKDLKENKSHFWSLLESRRNV